MSIKYISCTLGEKESFSRGLGLYRDLLENNLVTKDEVFFHQFNVVFLDGNNEELKIDKLKSNTQKIIKDYLTLVPSNESLNEVLFFAYALEIEGLKSEIIETLRVIIDYSRENNDTNKMWIGEDSVFGLGPIYLFAKVYKEYTYLLGAYLFPYWDDEHAPYATDLILDYTNDLGICRDSLKLLAYCDNQEIKRKIFGEKYIWDYKSDSYILNPEYKSIKEWFVDNKEEYEWFKEVLIERFKEYDFLQYSDNDFEEHPIDTIYYSFFGESDVTENFSEFFIYNNCDIEAKELEEKIILTIGKPLVEVKEEDDDENDYYYKGKAISNWKEFITEYFGYHIWSYIENGGPREILDEIKGIKGKELIRITKEIESPLYSEIKYFVGGFETVEEELESIVRDIFYDLHDENYNINVENIIFDSRSNYQLVRFIDFLYNLFSKLPFHRSFVDYIVEEYQLLSLDEFEERYCVNLEEKFFQNARDFFERDKEAFGEELEKLYKDFSRIREENPQKALSILNDFREYDPYGFKKNSINSRYLLFRAYIFSKDIELSFEDLITKDIKEDLNNNFLDSLIEKIRIGTDKEDLVDFEEIKNIILFEPKMPPQELMMKLMKEGIDKLNSEEKEMLMSIRNQKSPSKDELQGKIEKVLLSYADQGKKKYSLFDEADFRIDMQIIYLLSRAYYNSFNREKIKGFDKAEMLFSIFLSISPIIFLNISSKLWRKKWEDFSDEIMGLIDFKDSLKQFKILDENFYTWHFEFAIRNSKKELESLIDLLGDIDEEAESSFFGSIDKKKREVAYKGLEKISVDMRIEILEKVKEKYERDTELNIILLDLLKEEIINLIESEDDCQLLLNNYESASYNGPIVDFEGDLSYLSNEKYVGKENLLKKLNDYRKNYHIFIEQKEDSYKIYGHRELIGALLNKKEYEGYFPYKSKVIITNDIGKVIRVEDVVEDIYNYFVGNKTFEEIEKYQCIISEYIKRYNNKIDFANLLNKLDSNIFLRTIKFLEKGNNKNLDNIIEDVLIENIELFDEVQKIISEERLYNVVFELLKSIDEEEIEYINTRMSVVEAIQKQELSKKIKIIKRLKEKELKIDFSVFENDESRLIRDLFN